MRDAVRKICQIRKYVGKIGLIGGSSIKALSREVLGV